MNNLCGNEFLTGPFDECIECEYLCNGCSGPRTNAMTLPRWIVWIKAVMRRFNISPRAISEATGLSKSTLDDIFAGRRKDISRETACLIENFVLGDGKWPCAKKLTDGKDIVYEDRPETLEALKSAREALIERDERIASVKAIHSADVQEYKELVLHLRTQIDRKDDYIDRLAKKAGI